MKRYYMMCLICLLTTPSFCKTPNTLAWEEWVPTGWKIIRSETGDLNKDGRIDAVLVLEEDNPANRKPSDSASDLVLNLNPRRLVILLKTASGYQKAISTDRFLPSENNDDVPCLSDPLLEGDIRVSRGLLKIKLHYWYSCGTWSITNNTFSFRYENNRFRLIGLDVFNFARNSGESSEYSTNYLTEKQKITTELDVGDGKMKPKITWKKIPLNQIFYLDKITSDCDTDSKEDNWCK